MRVAFDVSELGWFNQTGHRGIRRVISHLAQHLCRTSEISARFCGLSEFNVPAVSAELGEDISARCITQCPTWAATLARECHSLREKNDPKRTLFTRAQRKLARLTWEKIGPTCGRLDAGLAKHADVFHSPFRPMPAALQRLPKLARFITIYDLIPIHFPEMAGAGAIANTKAILSSLREDTWIACISNYVKDDLCNHTGLPPDRMFVTPLAASSEIFRVCAPDEETSTTRARYGLGEKPYFLSLSAMDERKNLRLLVECFLSLVESREIDDTCLVLAGDPALAGPLKEAVSGFARHQDRILFPGFIADEDLAAVYAGALAFVFPSLTEGFGLPVLEAMQCGLPVISSNATSLPEVAGDACILLDPKDRDAWCDALRKVCADAALRSQMREKSLAMSQRFHWDFTVDRLIAAYRSSVDLPAP